MTKAWKVLLIVAVSSLLATTAFAKGPKDVYEKGTWMLGGGSNLDFATGTDTNKPDGGSETEDSVTTFGLFGELGYFVIDQLAIGGELGYDYNKTTLDNDDETTSSSILIGPFVTYVFDIEGRVDPFLRGLIGYQSNSTEFSPDGGDSTTTDSSGFAFDLAAGAHINVNSVVSVSPEIFYRNSSLSGTTDTGTAEADFDTTESRFGLRVGIYGFL